MLYSKEPNAEMREIFSSLMQHIEILRNFAKQNISAYDNVQTA